MTSAGVENDRRYVNGRRCPICGGADHDPRGAERRCYGFISRDGDYVHCSREEHAGGIKLSEGSRTFGHRLNGPCACGTIHNDAEPPRAASRIVATYDYHDESGELLYQVVRFEPKAFRQRRPDGAGGWIWKLGDMRRVIYRLDRLLESDPLATVYIVEGEKDVQALETLGLVATCNPQGAGKWSYVDDCARTALAGRNVVIIADRDQPGREHAADVAARLRDVVSTARIIEATIGKDAADWISAGATADDIANAPDAPTQTVIDPDPAPQTDESTVSSGASGVDWASLLITKADRSPKRAYYNTAVFVRAHPEFAGRWSYDEMTGGPWFSSGPTRPEFVHYIRAQADCRLGYTPSPADVEAAIVAAAREKPFHPIQQYLRGVTWDGVPRLASMALDYLGSSDPLHAEMIRRWMIGAVARALRPGCKLDTPLMLVGAQGARKSTFFAVLGGEWFADTTIDITNKDSALQIHSAWIYELSELENVFIGARESRIKAWVTSTHDLFRPPYGRVAERRARSVVICGTTNREQFLTDNTGSRRNWVVSVLIDRIPVERLVEHRDQLWAEAVAAYDAGEPWWFTDQADEVARERANQQFQEHDSWEDPISAYLSSPLFATTTMTEVLEGALKIDIARHDRASQMRAARILKQLGWSRYQGTFGWGYRRSNQPT